MNFKNLLAFFPFVVVFGNAIHLTPRAQQACTPIVQGIALHNNSRLPDPFTLVDGTRVRTKQDWECRRQELSSLFQIYEFGPLPGKPSSMNVSFVSDALTITAGEDGRSISWTVDIEYPTNGSAPFPAIITLGGASIPIPDSVAVINFDNGDFAEQNDLSSRGVGTFFDLFPSETSSSAMIAWTWGVSRIIDALEMTPSANIDTTKLALTGCSRNGKGTIVAGAFEERIALTIPEESGSGGTACWRLSDWQLDNGQLVQTASEIVNENVWESTSFRQFANDTSLIPFDHHELAGMIAPRGLLVVDNADFLWLGPESCFGCMKAGRLIYEALGVKDNFGYSSVGNHSHCLFPAAQTDDVNAFIDKFLFAGESDTDIFYATENFSNFSLPFWANWEVPVLS